MTRYLLIANRTLGGPELVSVIQDRMARGPAEFHVMVPATAHPGLMDRVIDAYAGERDAAEVSLEQTAAQSRLDRELERLREMGATSDGEIGPADPMEAAKLALAHGEFDEVILSTLPAGASHWLGMDLPQRLERLLQQPVTHVMGPPTHDTVA